jgi:type II secretory pathway component PulF
MLSPGRQTGTLEEELNITARPYNQRIDLKVTYFHAWAR